MNKHDVNIKKGKLINFQIGIIAVISFCYVMHEVSHYVPNKKKDIASLPETETTATMGPVEVWVEPEIVPEQPKEVKIEPTPKKIKVEPTLEPKVVDNKVEIEPTKEKTTSTEVKTDIPTSTTTTTVKVNKTKKINGVANSKTVDMMPIFPGCHKYSTNDELAVCFQEKIQRMINNRFDRSLGDELGISGKQYISLYFEINEQGRVSNIIARSKYPEFIEEAKRVASSLPKMEPARRSGQKVTMAYNVPIKFIVQN